MDLDIPATGDSGALRFYDGIDVVNATSMIPPLSKISERASA
jgi:hypothetical protein